MRKFVLSIGTIAIALTMFAGPPAVAEELGTESDETSSFPTSPPTNSDEADTGDDLAPAEPVEELVDDELPETPTTSPGEDVWFADELAAEVPAEFSDQARTVQFDADAALNSLIDSTTLIEAIGRERVAIPADQTITLEGIDGTVEKVHIAEIGVSVPVDSNLPTVEALGTISTGETDTSASFVFLTDETGEYHLSGSLLGTDSGDLSISPLGEDGYVIDEVSSNDAEIEEGADDTVLPPEQEDDYEPLEELELCGDLPCAPAPSGNYNVTLLAGAATGTGSLASMKTEMATYVAESNAAFVNSNMRTRLQLMDTRQVSHAQHPDMGTDLTRLATGYEELKSLKTRRDAIGADLLTLIVPDYTAKACGIGHVPGKKGNANASYSVVAKTCLNTKTLAHEIGHNLGSGHDPDNTTAGIAAIIAPYAYGHRVTGVVRDIMAYDCKPSCPRVNQFANPNRAFIGFPGRPSGTSTRNAARAIDEVAKDAQNYRVSRVAFDVPASHQFYTEITWLVNRRITTGYADGTFRPKSALAREAMAAFLYRMAGKPSFTPPSTSPFSDVPKSHKFYKEITWLRSTGITTGYANGTFGPSGDVNRSAMAAFLYRFAGKPSFTPPSTSPFSDVPKSHQFYKEITWLRSTGITTGYAGGTYGPSDRVTREAMAAFLYRYNELFD